ncbi:hypothetical protein EVAR_82_1 [Eumeta japonica]|uniref:Uncharacterized protein n=1 Tax=Eumeta variegata TaxID=151549 RepID=A0A4C1S7Z9_EUMVA|nr:hypothetical protein EVAR_82_1 [Eumeta japonica]
MRYKAWDDCRDLRVLRRDRGSDISTELYSGLRVPRGKYGRVMECSLSHPVRSAAYRARALSSRRGAHPPPE